MATAPLEMMRRSDSTVPTAAARTQPSWWDRRIQGRCAGRWTVSRRVMRPSTWPLQQKRGLRAQAAALSLAGQRAQAAAQKALLALEAGDRFALVTASSTAMSPLGRSSKRRLRCHCTDMRWTADTGPPPILALPGTSSQGQQPAGRREPRWARAPPWPSGRFVVGALHGGTPWRWAVSGALAMPCSCTGRGGLRPVKPRRCTAVMPCGLTRLRVGGLPGLLTCAHPRLAASGQAAQAGLRLASAARRGRAARG
jgi:hypothetical protein